MTVDIPSVTPRRFSPWLILLGALLIPLVYVPTLATRFDFIDDGNLVYPAPPMPAGERLHLVWEKIVANYEHLGPFRPVLWLHWELAAEMFRADPFRWRCARLAWSAIAVAALLALLRELRVRPTAALFATALAFWNPYRNEIWTSLTLSEGVAMPYALAALWCAARHNRSARAWPWDIASVGGVIAALGCKNVFAAVVPAQMYLRLYADGAGWRDGLRAHGKRAAMLALTLGLPIVHYVYFRLHWHPGQYPSSSPTLAQLGRLLHSVAGAESMEFIGVGLGLALAAIWIAWRSGLRPSAGASAPFAAGALLLAAGVAVYLPMPAISGRYTMPAVWGLDLIFAGLLSTLSSLPAFVTKRAAWVGLLSGLTIVACANVGRQEKFAARAATLWDALEYVEATTAPTERIEWCSGPDLNVEEGIHFQWHLKARGHDEPVELCDDQGRALERCEIPVATGEPSLALTGTPMPPPGGPWALRHAFRRSYWAGRREFDCFLWAVMVTR